MKYLITGGAGFIGSNIAEELVKRGHKVRILDSQSATGARVRVLIDSTDGERSWGTVGASSNIIEASWRALSDSFEYFLLTDENTEFSGVEEGSEPLEMIQTGVGVA